MDKCYNVGIYTRISVDDTNNSSKRKGKHYIPSDTSESIENQREMLSKFVMLNGWIETKVYSDDGYSGANFQRPAFLEMLEDVKAGKINLVLVRDLSRLGRDYIEVGRYTNDIFPAHHCRFIALLDQLDTAEDNSDMLHFRSLMNDYHLKELSNKIKVVLLSKAKQGQFLGSYAPYGYRKHPDDKHKLIVDPYAAKVVQKIYEMRENHISYNKIVRALNQEEILAPFAYWHPKSNRWPKEWKDATVRLLLRNEVYTGVLIQNRTGSMSYKNKTIIPKAESEWVRIENNHEPIISQEQWANVQNINVQAKKVASRNDEPILRLFRGKLICADCRVPLYSNVCTKHYPSGIKKYVAYSCTTHRTTGLVKCSWHTISERNLIQLVMSDIKRYATMILHDEQKLKIRLEQQIHFLDDQGVGTLQKEQQKLQKRLQELERLMSALYEDKVSGKLPAESFSLLMSRNETERNAQQTKLERITAQLDNRNQQTLHIDEWMKTIRKYLHLETLNRSIIDELIEHIEIGEKKVVDGKTTQDIKIFYRFVGCVG